MRLQTLTNPTETENIPTGPVRTVKVGDQEYQQVGADYPNRAAIRARVKAQGGFKKDKPFKGARSV